METGHIELNKIEYTYLSQRRNGSNTTRIITTPKVENNPVDNENFSEWFNGSY